MGILNDQYNERIRNGYDPDAPVQPETPEEATEVAAAEPEQQPSHTFSANTEPAQAAQERPAAATPDRRTFAQVVQRRTRSYIAGLALGAVVIGGAVAHAASKTHSEPPHPRVETSAPIDPTETSPTVDPTPTETSETPTTTTSPELPAETTGPLAKYDQETLEEFAAHPVPEHLFYSYTDAERVTGDLILSDWFVQKFPDGEIIGDYLPPVKNLDETSDGTDIARQAAANRTLALAWKVDENAPISPDSEELNHAVAEKLAFGATLGGSKAYYALDKQIKNTKYAAPTTEEELAAWTVTNTSPLISTDTAYDNVNLKGKVLTVEFAPDEEHPEKRVYKDTYAYVPNGYGEGKNAYLLASHELVPSAK